MSEAEPKTARQIAGEAAEYINEHGWIQRTFRDESGSVCALGALRMAAFGRASLDWRVVGRRHPNSNAYLYATTALNNMAPGPTIAHYNDLPSTTREDILLLLRKVAAGDE